MIYFYIHAMTTPVRNNLFAIEQASIHIETFVYLRWSIEQRFLKFVDRIPQEIILD